ncbi:hypothetical protein FRB95_009954 [Tulasnella sp. JGI-2019a]|nr:hypothetical protein FRB93_008247 [Tulasnella sp. JGI-2019a]KAG9025636.1 hypothetical protein FRB95_009954 [Tulasnella sp. JGI-2019a]
MTSVQLPKDFPVADSDSGVGKITLNQLDAPNDQIYTISFNCPPDNRVTPGLVGTLLKVLDVVEEIAPKTAVLVTTSAIGKFYSNGLNLDKVMQHACPEFQSDYWNPLTVRLLTFPIPTIAWMNGHTFAAGFIFAMFHDYRVMSATRGWCCLNEVETGVEIHPASNSIFREKLDARTYRTIFLEGKRFTGPEALAAGIVDAIGDMSDVIKLVKERNLLGRGSKGVYGLLRDEMHRETIGLAERYQKHGGLQRGDNEKAGLPGWSKL